MKIVDGTANVASRHLFLPMWEHATGAFLNGWLAYEPAVNPYMVRVEIEDFLVPLDVPRVVLAAGLDVPTACNELRSRPMTGTRYVQWQVMWGVVEPLVLRVPSELLNAHMAKIFELVGEDQEETRTDWDGEFARLQMPHPHWGCSADRCRRLP